MEIHNVWPVYLKRSEAAFRGRQTPPFRFINTFVIATYQNVLSKDRVKVAIYIYLRESVEKERDKRESRGEQWLGEEWNLLKSPSPACKTN